VDEKGRVKLSRKAAMEERDREMKEKEKATEPAPDAAPSTEEKSN
jgi:hypothetical protein